MILFNRALAFASSFSTTMFGFFGARATLFGLSALSGGIFLGMLSRQEVYSMLLNSNMLYFMTSSYILFIIGLIDGFLCLFNPGVAALIVSAACTVGGSINGSSSLVLAFRDYLFKSKDND